ncbi:DUF411 domain-containing protein [Ramlibacter rhizophilus]|uniref:DUF411 domain-containing protein n=1 Tax=Ramlibacter rhizophilus TaxID=1781167 RepID=A0A4Z0C0F1_9BURK|nr:DUF411 domain-containing protein [Ramlibacter rhizophilus]TFZ05006.1 DUF411 domain-containing protein [Ramlibacter rhizophilus]
MIDKTTMPRRGFLATVAALAAAPALGRAASPAKAVPVEVWKDPNCGCCGDWVKHLEDNGFQVKVNDVGNTAARSRLGIDPRYGSCHTALVEGYAIEGHVPAADILRLLREKPQALGLAVPGMPVGSPGMDDPAYGGRRDAYKVLLLARDGSSRVWQAYPGNKA